MSKKISLPTKRQIKNYWKDRIVDMKKNAFDSIEQLDSADYCFSCGIITNNHTERAHILARCNGGEDTVDNLHLLCSICHKESEILDGEDYFEWFKKRNHIDCFLDTTYKKNYTWFKEFHSLAKEAEKEGTDVYSKEFLLKINSILSFYFKIK